jgi:Uncharacterized protein conserved in archaea
MTIDPVANNVLKYLKNHFPLIDTDIIWDGQKVQSYTTENYIFYCVSLNDVLSHDYNKYLEFLKKDFSDCYLAGVVNWHAGDNAPNNILTVHSTGDVPTGIFAPSNPAQIKGIFKSLERNRIKFGLSNYHTLIEATHWSGIPYGQDPKLITGYTVPIYDIEIGSEKDSWEDPLAIQALAESLFDLDIPDTEVPAFIGIGGKHFEDTFSDIIQNNEANLVPGHILPNQWVANENYDDINGKLNLDRCIASIQGKVCALVFHDNLKGSYKQLCRDVATAYGIPSFKHKTLRNMEQLKQQFSEK